MYKESSGFTLIELIVVIAILGIIAAIAVSGLARFRSNAEEKVCTSNLKTIDRMYSAFLIEQSLDHEEPIFHQFLDENFDQICPLGGDISYINGKSECSIHVSEEQPLDEEPPGDEPPGGEVPWL